MLYYPETLPWSTKLPTRQPTAAKPALAPAAVLFWSRWNGERSVFAWQPKSITSRPKGSFASCTGLAAPWNAIANNRDGKATIAIKSTKEGGAVTATAMATATNTADARRPGQRDR